MKAWLARKEFGADAFEIVYPSSVSWPSRLSRWSTASWTTRSPAGLRSSYLRFLYTREAQEIIAKNYYRPRDVEVVAQYAEHYPSLKLVTIKDFGGWDAASAAYFADGAMFDRIFTPRQ